MSRGNYKNPCLTMHQPWASLLVHGIKRIEGRSWPAPIRGCVEVVGCITCDEHQNWDAILKGVMGWAYARGEHITKEHLLVYWLGPVKATLLAV